MIPRDDSGIAENPNCQLTDTILLDTEGMYDPDRKNATLDYQLFVAATLLSSMLVYNTAGVINEQAIEQLGFITELSGLIMVKTGASPDHNEQAFKNIFPSLFWVVRDFFLSLEAYDYDPDKYLSSCIQPKVGKSRYDMGVTHSNMIRHAISEFFSSLHCCTIAMPGVDELKLQHLDKLPYEELSPKFRDDCQSTINRILNEVRPKRLVNPDASLTDPLSFMNITPRTLLK
jgi:hypothetical protein